MFYCSMEDIEYRQIYFHINVRDSEMLYFQLVVLP